MTIQTGVYIHLNFYQIYTVDEKYKGGLLFVKTANIRPCLALTACQY